LWRTQAPKRRPPGFIEPCIPTRVDKPPVGPQWIHEIKHDGYRLIARKQGDRVRLFTRRGYDWTARYPLIASAVARLRATSAVIDGEAVFCDDSGLADFEMLHSRDHDARALLYAFELLELDGADQRPQPLEARKAALARLLKGPAIGIQYGSSIMSTSPTTARPSLNTPASWGSRASSRSAATIPTSRVGQRPGSRSRTRPLPACSGSSTSRDLRRDHPGHPVLRDSRRRGRAPRGARPVPDASPGVPKAGEAGRGPARAEMLKRPPAPSMRRRAVARKRA